MPAKSPFPDIEIPNVDLWGLMFERKEKDFPDSKGTQNFMKANCKPLHTNLAQSYIELLILRDTTPLPMSKPVQLHLVKASAAYGIGKRTMFSPSTRQTTSTFHL